MPLITWIDGAEDSAILTDRDSSVVRRIISLDQVGDGGNHAGFDGRRARHAVGGGQLAVGSSSASSCHTWIDLIWGADPERLKFSDGT